MNQTPQTQRSALVFGTRNLGKAVIECLEGEGWAVAGVACSQATLVGITASGALALRADVTDAASVEQALSEAAAATGGAHLVVNAAAATGGVHHGTFGGGPIAEATADAFEAWATAPARAAFSLLSGADRFLLEQGRPATIVQATGGSARRAISGRGSWATGALGVRGNPSGST